MATLSERIQILLRTSPGLTDREITDAINGYSAPQQPINQKCRALKNRGILIRQTRSDGLIGNYLSTDLKSKDIQRTHSPVSAVSNGHLSEDDIKKFLEKWLTLQGWSSQIAWGKSQGVDIQAKRGDQRWLIEVKGEGSRSAMRVNYFLHVIGELLQRMNDPNALYSIALPALQQFRNLWSRLPRLAKERTKISALFVDLKGNIEQVS